ncbi:hypothetical protein EBU99_11525 [bacterium]|nr:hypothetical protein [bacterium]
MLRTQPILFALVFCVVSARDATALDWELQRSAQVSVEGGWLAGSKIPMNSASQSEYDTLSAKYGPGEIANAAIKTLRLQGLEGLAGGNASLGYEGFSDDLNWQSAINIFGSTVVGNSTGTFYNAPDNPLVATQGLGGRNSGWEAGTLAAVHWVPLSSFSVHLRSSYAVGTNAFKDQYSRIQFEPGIQLKAARFVMTPSFAFQRLLSSEALPALDLNSWAFDFEWIGTRTWRLQNPAGFPLIKSWRAAAIGSSLVVKALENEGHFLEFNLSPKLNLTPSLVFSSHFRAVSGSEQSYVAPSLAEALNARGKQKGDWTPSAPSADFTSQTIEWKNSLIRRMSQDWTLTGSILYTSKSSAFNPSSISNLRYSTLIDAARESSFRYFLGSEFLL